MVVQQKYQVIDAESGMLDSRVFTDEQFYQDELEKVFGRAWLFIGHESLIPNPNDFFLTYMGEDPVILTRDAKGEVHAFLNMCRHRGNRIVRADDGNAKNFMCSYHGWTYSNEGKLVSVPGLQEAYYGELDVDSLGLVSVAHLDIYAGIVFATWASDAPTLKAYLGDARWYLDTQFNRRDGGMQAYGPMKWTQPVNWKAPVDNSSDNYHVAITHLGSAIVQSQALGRPRTSHEGLFKSPAKHLSVNGHGLTFRMMEANEPRRGHGVTKYNLHLFQEYQQDTLPEVERRLGSFRAQHVQLGNHSLFPNGVLGFRLALPQGPLQTEFWHFSLVDKEAPEEIKRALRTGSQGNNGAAGMFEQDDIDNWRQVSESGRSPVARRYPQDLSMGVGHASIHPDYPGMVSERYISENNQRNYYARWQEFMNAESWADIHIDPITASFEGTAGMRG
jgi:phenylpropionate dioxygenase-like ring-hydroxylating dioxygenase large terminal subunit